MNDKPVILAVDDEPEVSRAIATCVLHGAGVPKPAMDALLSLRNAATTTAPMRTPNAGQRP